MVKLELFAVNKVTEGEEASIVKVLLSELLRFPTVSLANTVMVCCSSASVLNEILAVKNPPEDDAVNTILFEPFVTLKRTASTLKVSSATEAFNISVPVLKLTLFSGLLKVTFGANLSKVNTTLSELLSPPAVSFANTVTV